MRSPETDAENLQKLDQLTEQLTADEETRTAIQLELSRLNHKNAYYLHELFNGRHIPFYSALLIQYIRFAWFLWIVTLVLTIITHAQLLFLLALGLTLFNFYLHYSNKKIY